MSHSDTVQILLQLLCNTLLESSTCSLSSALS